MANDDEWIGRKKVGFVRDLFRELRIDSFDGLRSAIAGQDEIGSICKFDIYRSGDLSLDNENRSHEKTFAFKRAIFDCDEISLQNSKTVDLVDCIFLGSLYIGRKEDYAATLKMDTCVIEKTLQYGVSDATVERISLTDVAALTLKLVDFTTDEIDFSGCFFGAVIFDRVKSAKVFVFSSLFGRLEKSDSQLENVNFPPGTLDVGNVGKKGVMARIWSWIRPFDFLRNYLKKLNFDSFIQRVADHENSRVRLETIEFLLTETSLKHNKKEAAQLKYVRALEESRSWLSEPFN